MKVFHTTDDAAKAILSEGFRDGSGTYMTAIRHSGVWIADQPLDENEGAKGNQVLWLEIPEKLIAPYEWIEEGKHYREFLVPAKLLNRFGPPRRHVWR